LRAVVNITGRVGNLKGVCARGKVLRSPSEGTAGATGSNGLDILEISARASLQLYSDRVSRVSPRDSERLVLRDRVVGVGELNSLGENSEGADEESRVLHVGGGVEGGLKY
jgi:hypothetical protein